MTSARLLSTVTIWPFKGTCHMTFVVARPQNPNKPSKTYCPRGHDTTDLMTFKMTPKWSVHTCACAEAVASCDAPWMRQLVFCGVHFHVSIHSRGPVSSVRSEVRSGGSIPDLHLPLMPRFGFFDTFTRSSSIAKKGNNPALFVQTFGINGVLFKFYVCICMNIYMHVYAYMCIYVYICIYIWIYMYICMCICLSMYIWAYMYLCSDISMHMCICVDIHNHICNCMHLYIYCICMNMHMHAFIYI